TKPLPDNFEVIVSEYLTAENQVKTKVRIDMINQWFVEEEGVSYVEFGLASAEEKMRYPLILQEAALADFLDQRTLSFAGSPSYEVPQLFAHALLVPIPQWSPNFGRALLSVAEHWSLQAEDTPVLA